MRGMLKKCLRNFCFVNFHIRAVISEADFTNSRNCVNRRSYTEKRAFDKRIPYEKKTCEQVS